MLAPLFLLISKKYTKYIPKPKFSKACLL